MDLLANTSVNSTLSATAPWISYRSELLTWYYCMVALSCVSSLFCLLVLAAILSSRKLRFGSGALIANFLISLLLQSALFVPLVTASTSGVPLGLPSTAIACRNSFVGYFILNKVVSMADMMIGINRFVAICFPHHYPKWTTKPVLAGMIGLPWLLSLLFGFAIFFGWGGVYQASPPWNACAVTFASSASSWLSLLMGVLIPIGTLGILFSIIFTVILFRWVKSQKSTSDRTSKEHLQRTSLQRRRYQSIRMLFVSYVCYSACFMPTQIASAMFSKEFRIYPVLQLLLRAVALLGYAVVPVIYLAMNRGYRSRLRYLLKRSGIRCGADSVRPSDVGETIIMTEGNLNRHRTVVLAD